MFCGNIKPVAIPCDHHPSWWPRCCHGTQVVGTIIDQYHNLILLLYYFLPYKVLSPIVGTTTLLFYDLSPWLAQNHTPWRTNIVWIQIAFARDFYHLQDYIFNINCFLSGLAFDKNFVLCQILKSIIKMIHNFCDYLHL